MAQECNKLVRPVSGEDVWAAWRVLENLTVSLDQIGGKCDTVEEVRDALLRYFTPDLVGAISDARSRLSRYLPDAESEKATDDIPYWEFDAIVPAEK